MHVRSTCSSGAKTSHVIRQVNRLKQKKKKKKKKIDDDNEMIMKANEIMFMGFIG